ncbi:hypothetical protein J3B02_002685 [Coemansia erecta]|uniref:Uncharacterized protein n=1 Tax=Coemansia asiatica TaxID=1052880 RepID=A0A9W7XMN5_9FUNG|nr:hypothetical protein LPJ64_002969 [Coemansia asiatica]KAJ2854412.1 hypothetical protein J3B02_002685 [Coemansia erecta]KAJ2882385.1 hypothetical protein FB639_002400 [Coemansia asiatica]
MKSSALGGIYILCSLAAAMGPMTATLELSGSLQPHQTPNMQTQKALHKRKLDAEDPANPVAAAATDPNEAAMKIKSRDLINTDRQDFRPDPHPHRHHGQARQDSEDDDNKEPEEESDGDSKKSGKKGAGKKKADKDDDSDENAKEDSDDSDAKQKPKGKSATKQKSSSKDSGKKSGSGKGKNNKGSSSKDSKKGKKTHTGLDGKEVDDEDEEDGEMRKKKIHVKHVKAKQRRWRTGKPKYNYKQALNGWKEVGPLYYYKGKYENSAISGGLTTTNVLGSALAAMLSATAMLY